MASRAYSGVGWHNWLMLECVGRSTVPMQGTELALEKDNFAAAKQTRKHANIAG